MCGWQDGQFQDTVRAFAEAGPLVIVRRLVTEKSKYGQKLRKGISIPVLTKKDVRVNGVPVLSGRMMVEGKLQESWSAPLFDGACSKAALRNIPMYSWQPRPYLIQDEMSEMQEIVYMIYAPSCDKDKG